MNCSTIKNILKEQNDLEILRYFVGKIDDKYDHAICIYSLANENERNVALGGLENTTYEKSFQILIKWNKNYTETEEAAQKIYNFFTNLKELNFDDVYINYTELLNNEPIDLHCGDDGIYERSFDFKVYYKEK